MPRLSNVASCGQLCLHSNSTTGRSSSHSSSRNLQRDFVPYSQHLRRSGRTCALDFEGGGNKIALGRKLSMCPTLRVPEHLAQAGAALTGSSPEVSARDSSVRRESAAFLKPPSRESTSLHKPSSREMRRCSSQPALNSSKVTYFSDCASRCGKQRPMPRPVLT